MKVGSFRTPDLPADLFIPNTQLREPSDSILSHVLLYAVQLVALAAPRFHGKCELVIGLIAILAVSTFLNPHFTNDAGLAQPFTIGWSFYMATLEKYLFAGEEGPEGTVWSLDGPDKEALEYVGFGLRKWYWAVVLLVNQRGVRWNFEIKNVPHMKKRRRWAFVAARIVESVYCVLMGDLCMQLMTRLNFTTLDGRVGAVNSKYLTMYHQDWRWTLARAWAFGAGPWYMVRAQYDLISVVAVSAGLSRPENWPPLFGDIREATTVRAFWGKVWHQQLRKMLTAFTNAFVDGLAIKRGTVISSHSTLWLAFTISGFFHASSQLSMPSPQNITVAERTTGVALFFLCQASAITFEDGVQGIWKKIGGGQLEIAGKWAEALLGYLWVIFVLGFSIPLAGDTFLAMRMGAESLLPFTVWGPLVEKYIPIP